MYSVSFFQMSRSRLLFLGVPMIVLGVLGCADPAPEEAASQNPDAHEGQRTQAEKPVRAPDAGEGAKAKREEGRVGRSPMESGRAYPAGAAGNAGALGRLRDGVKMNGFGGAVDAEMLGGTGGMIGAKGTQIGSGGLGSRGSGFGGGGTVEGLGGLGTAGLASGASGYGSGGGNFGNKGMSSSGVLSGHSGRTLSPNSPAQFTDHGVNPMHLVSDDKMSTFGADVDTASYTFMRNRIQMAHALPRPESVRVEEYVNYFPYPMPDPSNGQVFSVKAEAAPSPWTPQRTILRIGVNTAKPDPSKRKPMALTFLVDTSGSMKSREKLPLALESLRTLVSNLGPEDTVALATYAGYSKILLPPTPTTQSDRIYSALAELNAGGSTAMGSGINMAYELADKAYRKGIENRVIILSDGDANVGPVSHEALLDQIQKYAGRGITLSTIGFGRSGYRDTLMEQLANKGDGNSYYIDSPKEADRVFGAKLLSTLQSVARDVKLQVEFHEDAVLSYRLIGYENRDIADKDFRNDAVDAGEVGMGHSVTALYELVMRDNPKGKLATVRIRSKKPGPDRPATEVNFAVPQSVMRSEWADASRSYRIALGAASFAEVLRRSPHVSELTLADVEKMVAGSVRKGIGEDRELLSLIRAAKVLQGDSGVVSIR